MATMILDELVTQLRAAYGSRLSCVVLYGSAAKGAHVPKKSDFNVLVLLDVIEPGALTAASAVANAWREAGNPPPLTMTVQEWRRSSDVFPMEYADILARHLVLHGEPPFDGIRVSREHLRLQLEHEAMGKLLRLRQAALLAGPDEKRQLDVMDSSFSTIMVLFRAAVRLAGEEPPADNAALAQRVAALAGFDAAAFVRIDRHHRGESRIDAADASPLLGRYLTGVERLDAYLDTFTTQEGHL